MTGVDGCRAGWISFNRQAGFRFFETFARLIEATPGETLYVDIPMGLTRHAPRNLETLARTRLKGKASSIFSVPCRDAVYATDYRAACDINAAVYGTRLSLQSWNITPKIREVDQVLHDQPSLADQIFESHPELSFYRLSLGTGQDLPGKKTSAGIAARLALLDPLIPGAEGWFDDALGRWRRKDVARDDLLDAMVLSVLGDVAVEILGDPGQPTDESGIPVRMVIPRAI